MKDQVIVINGMKITPKIVDGLSQLKSEISLTEMKDAITRILFMISMGENSRQLNGFVDTVFMLNVLYDISDSIFDEKGGDE